MKRVLVTGATGFVGSHTVDALVERGFEVHAVASGRTAPPADGPVHWHVADLLDPSQATRVIEDAGAEYLLHNAWYVEPGKLISSPLNLDWLSASTQMLQSFYAKGGRRAVCTGSCYEYDWRYGYCSEPLTPCEPDTLYGAAKNSLRQAVEAFAHAQEKSFAWGRIFFLYGPRENPSRLVSSIILSLLNGNDAKCSHGLQIRDYAHVRDVAEGIATLLDSDAEGAFNIATGAATSIRDIALTIGNLLERPDLIKLGALPARANDLPLVVADQTRTIGQLQWQPRFGLEDGLRDTIDWWRSAVKENK